MSLGATRFLRSFLFEVSPFDPMTLGSLATLLFLVSLAAVALPARKAASADPLQAMRSE